MKNQMIVFKENKFFQKIKSCFYKIKEKLFGKKKYIEEIEKTESENNECQECCEQENVKDTFKQEIKVETDKIDAVYMKKEFLEEINGNNELLELLSIDRLKKLEEYYDDVIKQNELKINNLKKIA